MVSSEKELAYWREYRKRPEVVAMDLEICNYSSDTGVQVAHAPQGVLGLPPAPRNAYSWFKYDPLHDDAQAMSLVKRFRLQIDPHDEQWNVALVGKSAALFENLNRAIVECVAKMWSAHDQN